jgi:hypothetical protein
VSGLSSRVRIKQEYRHNAATLEYWLPPKWALNDRIAAWRQSHLAKIELAPAAIRATEGV